MRLLGPMPPNPGFGRLRTFLATFRKGVLPLFLFMLVEYHVNDRDMPARVATFQLVAIPLLAAAWMSEDTADPRDRSTIWASQACDVFGSLFAILAIMDFLTEMPGAMAFTVGALLAVAITITMTVIEKKKRKPT